MKDFWSEAEKKKLNKKKLVIVSSCIIFIIFLISIMIVYVNDENIRYWIDKNIFRKEIRQDKATVIEMKDQDLNAYAFDRYIGVLNKNKFFIYGSTGNQEKSLDIQINNPIFDSANRFLAIAENKGKNLYVITGKEISWQTEVEGNIAQVHVNKNGYIAVEIVDTSYKTVIVVYNSQGKRLFKTFLSSNRATDVTISNDNKYVAIAEVDTSGTAIQSYIKVISVEKASTDPTNSIENTYNCESGKLIVNIEYQEKSKLLCMYTDSISLIENNEEKNLIENNKKISFQSIELNNHAISVEEKSSGVFKADSVINIVNIDNKDIKEYKVDSVTKELYTYDDIIALNLGTEVEFINTSGWLVKRYVANQEITNIVVSNSIAGIVYRDKIEIVNL